MRCLQSAVSVTCTVFARSIDGYLFPALLCVKSLPNNFAGAIQKLQTPDNFILFSSQGHRVYGGTQESVKVLGNPSSAEVENGDVVLSEFLPEEELQRLFAVWEEHEKGKAGNGGGSGGGTSVSRSIRVSVRASLAH